MCKPRQSSRISLIAIVLIGLVAIVWSCDTPVYRFAMYNWNPTPYEVYHFYVDVIPKDQQAINAKLRKLSESDESRVNVSVLPIDLKDDLELAKTPMLPEVRKAWLKGNDRPTSGYMIVGPKGAVLHRGDLELKQIDALVQSKQRTQLGKQLENGDACVFLLLPGKNEKENAAAKEVIERVMSDVKSGKISLYQAPSKDDAGDPALQNAIELKVDGQTAVKKKTNKKDAAKKSVDAEAGKSADKKSDPPKSQVSMIVIDRSNKAEEWFVKNLVTLEEDLKDLSSPMVFPVYGRARALLPMVGKGIHYNNLVAAVEFVTGACSCEIKDDNPGVDLLVRYDWETAAGKIAEKFGREEGNQNRFAGDDLFPEILIPSGPTETKKSDGGKDVKDAPKAPAKTDDKKDIQVAKADDAERRRTAEQAGNDPVSNPDPSDKAVEKSSETDSSNTRVAALPAQEPADDGKSNGDAATAGGVMIIGTGIGLALLFLMVATLVIMRPR